MLDRSKGSAPVGVPSSESGFHQLFHRIKRRVYKIIGLRSEITPLVRDFRTYATEHRDELMGARKRYTMPDGSIVEWKEVSPRISCGTDEERKKVVALLVEQNLEDACVSRSPRYIESALREQIEKDPSLLEKILKVAPSFSLGTGYEQFSINFSDMDMRVVSNLATGVINVERKKE